MTGQSVLRKSSPHGAPHPYLVPALVLGATAIAVAVALITVDTEQVFLEALRLMQSLGQFTQTHHATAVLLYVAAFVVLVTVSIPGAMYLPAAGGFLFGVGWGVLYAVSSATVGAIFAFLLGRYVLVHWVHLRAGPFLKTVRKDIKTAPFRALLVMRLMPGCPFVATNLAAAALSVPFGAYASATLLGIIPSIVAQVMIGAGAEELVSLGVPVTLSALAVNPKIIGGLVALALIIASPLVHRFKRR